MRRSPNPLPHPPPVHRTRWSSLLLFPLPTTCRFPQGVPEEIATVWEVWSLLTEQPVDRQEFDPSVFDEAAVRGLIEGSG